MRVRFPLPAPQEILNFLIPFLSPFIDNESQTAILHILLDNRRWTNTYRYLLKRIKFFQKIANIGILSSNKCVWLSKITPFIMNELCIGLIVKAYSANSSLNWIINQNLEIDEHALFLRARSSEGRALDFLNSSTLVIAYFKGGMFNE